mgnify:CR=1 FL=1
MSQELLGDKEFDLYFDKGHGSKKTDQGILQPIFEQN